MPCDSRRPAKLRKRVQMCKTCKKPYDKKTHPKHIRTIARYGYNRNYRWVKKGTRKSTAPLTYYEFICPKAEANHIIKALLGGGGAAAVPEKVILTKCNCGCGRLTAVHQKEKVPA